MSSWLSSARVAAPESSRRRTHLAIGPIPWSFLAGLCAAAPYSGGLLRRLPRPRPACETPRPRLADGPATDSASFEGFTLSCFAPRVRRRAIGSDMIVAIVL
ncbi:hypothetical protein BCR44DRAFT_1430903 [Catenaria anguillulae PL171]|uniref:Uncharacterized protein n=1 Tax=Catenaria anguillulae PL171 TaxID=765915 RepID=A0A1Y2HU54_9FUNG|nr:hypothetical protein BCR44DRAFT_1430903 [Catenaria anguillulae PL171]